MGRLVPVDKFASLPSRNGLIRRSFRRKHRASRVAFFERHDRTVMAPASCRNMKVRGPTVALAPRRGNGPGRGGNGSGDYRRGRYCRCSGGCRPNRRNHAPRFYNLVVVIAQMAGLVTLLIGCLSLAGAIFSGRIGGFKKGGALILIGGYLAGFAASMH